MSENSKKDQTATNKPEEEQKVDWKAEQDKRKAELFDEAQRCLAVGDHAGYCGYMSALGDIGR